MQVLQLQTTYQTRPQKNEFLIFYKDSFLFLIPYNYFSLDNNNEHILASGSKAVKSSILNRYGVPLKNQYRVLAREPMVFLTADSNLRFDTIKIFDNEVAFAGSFSPVWRC